MILQWLQLDAFSTCNELQGSPVEFPYISNDLQVYNDLQDNASHEKSIKCAIMFNGSR